MKINSRSFKLASFAVALMVLSACSGGGGGEGNGAGSETINGISVPPEPDTTANQASIEGIDSNNNGIRDDVERMIAKEFGENPAKYVEAKNHATTLQTAITTPTPETTSKHIDLVRCVTDSQKLSELKKITTTTVDTSKRRSAYGGAFAGAVISTEGCEQ